MFTIVNQIWNAFLETLIVMCEQLKIRSAEQMTPAIALNQTAILRKTLTYGNIPFDESETLRIDDVYPRHRDALLRAASRLANAYPRDVVDATIWTIGCRHREFMIPIELHDNPEKPVPRPTNGTTAPMGLDARPRVTFADLEEEVKEHTWIGGMNQLSMADIVWFETLCWIRCGAAGTLGARSGRLPVPERACSRSQNACTSKMAERRVEGRAMSENKKLNSSPEPKPFGFCGAGVVRRFFSHRVRVLHKVCDTLKFDIGAFLQSRPTQHIRSVLV